jgi:hypothetical protein
MVGDEGHYLGLGRQRAGFAGLWFVLFVQWNVSETFRLMGVK